MKHERATYGGRTLTLGRSLTIPPTLGVMGPGVLADAATVVMARAIGFLGSKGDLVYTPLATWSASWSGRLPARESWEGFTTDSPLPRERTPLLQSPGDSHMFIHDPRLSAVRVREIRAENGAERVASTIRYKGRASKLGSVACKGCNRGCEDCDQFDYVMCKGGCGFKVRTGDRYPNDNDGNPLCQDCYEVRYY